MDGDERKIGMLIAAFDVERAQLQGAIAALNQIGVALKRDVKAATEGAAAGALKSLTPEIHSAEQVLKGVTSRKGPLRTLRTAVQRGFHASGDQRLAKRNPSWRTSEVERRVKCGNKQ